VLTPREAPSVQQPINLKEHWDHVYQTKEHDDVSWYQSCPATSLKLIAVCGVGKQEGIIDVGGGASVLVDLLLDAGFTRLAVLDISAAALAHAKERLGACASDVEWFEADVTGFTSPHCFNLWHDRAAFHFLTDKADRQKYVQTLKRTLTPDGHVIIATFAIDGPLKCSGLEVMRYDASAIAAELGEGFRLLEQVDETHTTPWGAEQEFSYFRFARSATATP
jgi:SAM-dependent methyltransferase